MGSSTPATINVGAEEPKVSQPDARRPGAGSSPPELGPGKTARGRARLPSSRRRSKPLLSCRLCRQMKLRCDRQHPCSNCTKRQLGQSCTYSPNADQPLDDAGRNPATVKDRIQHLESLVINLIQAQQGPPARPAGKPGEPPPFSPTQSPDCSVSATPDEDVRDPASPASDCGSIHITQSGPNYVNSAHWAAMLDDIAELRGYFEGEEISQANSQPPEIPSPTQTGPQLLYGCSKVASKEEILASIPPRPVVDRLVFCYFNCFEMAPSVLHKVQFLKEYEAFWQNPSATPVMWLGLLFTLMCIATYFDKYKLDPTMPAPAVLPSAQDLQSSIEAFRQKIVQCLVLGSYTKGGPFVIETLVLYFYVELLLNNDAEIGVWILLGTIMMVATHMGFHRDPKHFKGIAPFAGEMQKRLWATIVEYDLIISAQMGLPRLLKQWQADTTEPSNLHDWDFDKTTVCMPPSRPETDVTPMLFRIVKGRMMKILGLVWDYQNRKSYTYAEVMETDSKLQAAYASIPECFKWRSLAQCITDTHQTVTQKAALEILFHRARTMLHRKYLRFSPTDPHYGYSIKACLDSALTLLDFQHLLVGKTDLFTQLHRDRWRLHSLIKTNFLLATSILCLYLQKSQSEATEGPDDPMVGKIRASLTKSHGIWLRSSSSSKEAQKAAKALSVVLGIEHPATPDTSLESGPSNGMSASASVGSDSGNSVHDGYAPFSVDDPFQPPESTSWTNRVAQPEMEFMAPFPGFIPGAGNVEPQLMDVGAMDFSLWP